MLRATRGVSGQPRPDGTAVHTAHSDVHALCVKEWRGVNARFRPSRINARPRAASHSHRAGACGTEDVCFNGRALEDAQSPSHATLSRSALVLALSCQPVSPAAAEQIRRTLLHAPDATNARTGAHPGGVALLGRRTRPMGRGGARKGVVGLLGHGESSCVVYSHHLRLRS